MYNTIRAFDLTAEKYDEWYTTEKGRQVYEAELNALSTLIPEIGIGGELGSGTGIFANVIQTSKRKVVCLDLSNKMLAKAALRGLNSVQANAACQPFKSRLFDFIYMVTLIEFLSNPIDAFQDAFRTLKSGGCIIILFINPSSKWGEFYTQMKLADDPIFRHANLYTRQIVEEMLSSVGLIPVKSLGTLTHGPLDADSDVDLMTDTEGTGVILVKALKT